MLTVSSLWLLRERMPQVLPARCTEMQRGGSSQSLGRGGGCSALLFSSSCSQDQRDVKHFGRAAALKTASAEWREGQEPSEGCSTRWAGPRGSSLPAQGHIHSASNPPLGCRKQLSSHGLDPGWAGSCGSAGLPPRQGKQQGLGCPAWEQH